MIKFVIKYKHKKFLCDTRTTRVYVSLIDEKLIIDSLEQNIFVKDTKHRYLYANERLKKLFSSDVIGKSDHDFFAKKLAEKLEEDEKRVLEKKRILDTIETIEIAGNRCVVRMIKKPLYDGEKLVGLLGIFYFSTRKHDLLIRRCELDSKVLSKISDGLLVTDKNKKILKINEAFSKLSGYFLEDIKGKNPEALGSGWNDEHFYEKMWAEVEESGEWQGEITERKKNGEIYASELTVIALYGDDEEISNYVFIVHDISKRKKDEELIHNLAYFDSLTKLPNRVLFEERVNSSISSLKRSQKKMAILFMDMDNFKDVNDNFGHLIGDKFLIKVSENIKKFLRENDTLARLGGDEFIILLDEIDNVADIVPIANRIVNRFNKAVTIEGHKLYSGVSIGISIYPDDATNYEDLLNASDTAMYQVKDSGKNGFQFYKKSMNEKATYRMLMERDLRSALHNDELFLEYQPKVNLETNKVYGMEALIRWNHKEFGPIKPEKFIKIAESTGQIYEIGLWVFKQAVTDTKSLHDEGTQLTVSINVSSKQLDNKSFVYDICRIVEEIGLDKQYIELEINECNIMHNVKNATKTIKELYERGYKISIDDFGTGFSSLSYIKQLPAQTIKIDRSFVHDFDVNADDRSIVETIIAMGKFMGKDIVAEGSETKENIEALKFLNCYRVQGYYFSKPLPIEIFRKYVHSF